MSKRKSRKDGKSRGKEVIALPLSAVKVYPSSPLSEPLDGRATLIKEKNFRVYAHGVDSHCEVKQLLDALRVSNPTAHKKFDFILNITIMSGPPLNNDTWAKPMHGGRYKGLYEFIFCDYRIFWFRIGSNVIVCVNHLLKDGKKTSSVHLERALAIKESYHDIAR